MPRKDIQKDILSHLADGGHLTLFLDYDGTLVPIAPTPAEAIPDRQLIALLKRLGGVHSIRTIILSGRPLEDLRRMLPVGGLILGGLYGLEMQIGDQTIFRESGREGHRHSLVQVRDRWSKLAAGLNGFLIEDKGQAVALHARWADARQARRVLAAARGVATDLVGVDSFCLLDGDRYLEVAPRNADKGATADWLLNQFPTERDIPIAFGDDNKDESAFGVVQRRGGFAIGVGHRYPLPHVDLRLESPDVTRSWLRSLILTH
jgi:trehalose 6-phosphate phosphatase